ncbi:MAG: UbiX family flavin prenyltransferase [Planctomycetota bacterium]|nr:UbiX family flavin prenyltransferase [Planctomycetota bacterium]
MSANDIVLAITGASGSAYAIRLAQVLLAAGKQLHLVVSGAARQVLARELDAEFPVNDASSVEWSAMIEETLAGPIAGRWGFRPLADSASASQGTIRAYGISDYSSGLASGSFLTSGMVICPCSMGTLSAIAIGASTNLIQRAADVHLKERRALVLVPRETPLSLIQLENMTRLSQAGATIMPSMPGFYHQPLTIADLVDFVVARILDHLRVEQTLMERWGLEPG